jgi:hypothetical protein
VYICHLKILESQKHASFQNGLDWILFSVSFFLYIWRPLWYRMNQDTWMGCTHLKVPTRLPEHAAACLGFGYGVLVKVTSFARVAATCWSLWLSRNNLVFWKEKKSTSHLHVILLVTNCLCTWAILQKLTLQDMVIVTSQCLSLVAKELFTQAHGW